MTQQRVAAEAAVSNRFIGPALRECQAEDRADFAEQELRELRVRHIALKDAVRSRRAFTKDCASEEAAAQIVGGSLGLLAGAFIGSIAGGLAGTAMGMAGGLRAEDLDGAAALGSGAGAFVGSIVGLARGTTLGKDAFTEKMSKSYGVVDIHVDRCPDGRSLHEEVLANLAAKGIKL